MSNMIELNADMLDAVSGGLVPFSSTVSIGANGQVQGSYNINGRTGTFSQTLSVPVYQAGTFSLSAGSGGFSFTSSFGG